MRSATYGWPKLLAQQMAVRVRLCDADEASTDAFFQRAVEQPLEPQTERRRHGAASIAVCLPSGSVATWDVDADQAQAACRHCGTVLQLEATQHHKQHADAEVEALATQVCNDFEELSLIRSLAAAMALPYGSGAFEDLVFAVFTTFGARHRRGIDGHRVSGRSGRRDASPDLGR